MPLVRDNHILGGIAVNRKATGAFAPEVVALLQTFAAQSALAIQNARLFREIEVKSRELETASRHKSEFLANMSHELRTPLNAIIGFSEVLSERLFGDVNDKQAEYLDDIVVSGRHLLALINDILDLSKIEAGRMELDRSEFDLATAIGNTLSLVRERAQRRDIALASALDSRIGAVHADERKVKQVLLNLLSNALKFTPEGGRIDVRARRAHDLRRDRGHRHGRGHLARRSGHGVRGVPPGRRGGEEGRGHRARPRDLAQVRRAARRDDPRRQRGRQGLDVHVHAAAEVNAGRSRPTSPSRSRARCR